MSGIRNMALVWMSSCKKNKNKYGVGIFSFLFIFFRHGTLAVNLKFVTRENGLFVFINDIKIVSIRESIDFIIINGLLFICWKIK